MGDRFILTIVCPKCNHMDDDVYYAPTCGFVDWKCPKCGTTVDLEAVSGISYEDASNREEISQLCKEAE